MPYKACLPIACRIIYINTVLVIFIIAVILGVLLISIILVVDSYILINPYVIPVSLGHNVGDLASAKDYAEFFR